MKVKYTIREIDKETALDMIQRFHYSDSVPSLTRHFVGFYLEDELVGVVTLGWGTRPKHTIKKLFPELDTKDYWEIGRMCMTDEMPRHSESQMLSQLIKWMKKEMPQIKLLFTWADGMLGKVGYVYQGSDFKYAGYSPTEFYMKDGVKLHPRGMKGFLGVPETDKRKTVRPTMEQMRKLNIEHYSGKQFRYFYLIDKKYKGPYIGPTDLANPKEGDLEWAKHIGHRLWVASGKPDYKTDLKG